MKWRNKFRKSINFTQSCVDSASVHDQINTSISRVFIDRAISRTWRGHTGDLWFTRIRSVQVNHQTRAATDVDLSRRTPAIYQVLATNLYQASAVDTPVLGWDALDQAVSLKVVDFIVCCCVRGRRRGAAKDAGNKKASREIVDERLVQGALQAVDCYWCIPWNI